MQVLTTVASVLLGAVFLVSGASKVARGQQWPAEAARLGVPHSLTRVVPVVPWWEIVLGAALVAGGFGPWVAVAAAVTLIAFTVLLVGVLRRGEHPPCSCFGAWSTAPVGWRHVARNGALLCLAVLAAFR